MNRSIHQQVAEVVGTPTFIYSENQLLRNIQRVKSAISAANLEGRIKLQAAYFTNGNPHLYKTLTNENIGIVVQSPEEVYQLQEFDVENNLVAALSCATDQELDFFLDKNVPFNIFIPEELEYALQRSDDVGVRLDVSPMQDQRTGLKQSEYETVNGLFEKLGKFPKRIHTYPGTGSDCEKLLAHAEEVFKAFSNHFPYVKEINLGGGFAFDYDERDPNKKHFNWEAYFSSLQKLLEKYDIPEDVTVSVEPGRELFADVGELLVKVVRVHRKPHHPVQSIFTDGSYVLMPSATIRSRQHQVTFLNNDFEEITDRSGYGVLSGCTTLSRDYLFPGVINAPQNLPSGSYVAIQDIGAYGASQHLEFLNKRPASEVLIRQNGNVELITKRGSYTDRTRYVIADPKCIGEQK